MQKPQDTNEGSLVCFNLGRTWKEGEVIRKVEKDEQMEDGRTLHASPEDPAFIVRDKESGKELHRKLTHLWSCSPVQAPMGGEQQQFNVGDKVQYQVVNNYVSGSIIGVVTEDTPFRGRTIKASKENPQYIVRNDGTGAETHHHAASLVKISGGQEEGPSELPPKYKKRGPVEQFQQGQKVMFKVGRNWNYGELVERVTSEKELGGRMIHASEDQPQFIVKHSETGNLRNFHPIHLYALQ
jgi:hypothetical protein